MRDRFHLPVIERTPASDEHYAGRLAHMLRTDPDGCWVAAGADGPKGLAVALRRGPLWVLSNFAVDPSAQDAGVGRALLDRAAAYGDAEGPGLILSSRDPKAMRRYAFAGFALRPSVTAKGTVRRAGLARADGVRDGDAADLELAAHVDELQRGASHGPDFGALLDDGARLLVFERGTRQGYAVVRQSDHRPVVVAATDPDAAIQLLTAALADVPDGGESEVGWLTGAQQWAIGVCLRAGMELHPVGPVMVRGHPGPMAPYVPNGAYG
jgi:GNAT superfamily N-acetyltransferase